MKQLYTILLCVTCTVFSLTAIAQPCVDGLAGAYPCNKIDQIGMIAVEEFNAENTNDLWGWTSPITNREYVILGLNTKTAFIDITTPQHPLYLGYLPSATSASLWRDVKVIDHYAYIVSEADYHGMQVFDLNKLENLTSSGAPHQFQSDAYYNSFGNAHNVVVDTANKFVYGVGTSTFAGGLHIVDVSDPLNPSYAGSNALGGYVHDAQVVEYNGPDSNFVGEQIAVGFNDDRIVVYNVTDKSDIEVISESIYDNVGYVHQGWFTEDMRYLLSNDELDEQIFGINTRTLIWDMADLTNPQLVSYIDLGNASIDHNLYIRDDMVYESNYTNGLRILDLLDIETGQLEDFGYFDVVPETDDPIFIGTWSNYPYFKSGIVPLSGMFTGLHLVKPQFYALEKDVIKVCGVDTASVKININRRLNGPVTYSIEMENAAGLTPELEFTTSDSAPAVNQINWVGLNALSPGYYPGEVVITHNSSETRLPFALIKDADALTNVAAEAVGPNFAVLSNQNVTFTFLDAQPGLLTLQVSLNPTFSEIVYEETFYNAENSLQAYMPFDLTTYFWRLIKPAACGEDLVSQNETSFAIDIASEVPKASAEAKFVLYPNPANETVYIQSENKASYIVYDISGKQVARWIANGNNKFSVADLENGLYLVKPTDGVRGVKLIKN